MHELKSCKLKFSNLTLEICIKIFGHFWMKAVLSYRSLGNWVVVICSLVSWNSWEEVSQDPSYSIWVCSIVSSQRCLLTVVLCLIMWSVHQYSRHSPFLSGHKDQIHELPSSQKIHWPVFECWEGNETVHQQFRMNTYWIVDWVVGRAEWSKYKVFSSLHLHNLFQHIFFFFKLEHIFLQKRKRRKVTGSFSHLYVCLLWKK